MVYEYLLQFTDDPYLKDTLNFLMTREVAHFQMFEAALESIKPNFPPGVLQSDPRYSNLYFNMSTGNDYSGPWNEGPSSQFGEMYQYIEDPIRYVMQTNGLQGQKPAGTDRTQKAVAKADKDLSKSRSEEINLATPPGEQQWDLPEAGLKDENEKDSA
jgi:Mn-containing catalase